MRRNGSRLLMQMASILILCCGLLSAPAHASGNLLANPGFDTAGGSYTGWFTFGAGAQLSTPVTDNIARNGTAAAKLFGGFIGCPGAPAFSVCGAGQAFTPTVGLEYNFNGFAYVAGTDPITGTDVCNSNRLLAKIVFFNAAVGGAELQSNAIVIASGLSAHNAWLPFSVSTTAPVGAVRVEALLLFLQPGCDIGSAFVDDLQFTEGPTVTLANSLTNPSFNPGLIGWSTFGNVFSDLRVAAVHTRGGSAKMFSTFVANSPSGMFQTVTAVAGQVWELSAYALTTCIDGPISGTNDNLMTAKLVFRDALGADIGNNELLLADHTSPLGTWKRGVFSSVAPVGTTHVDAFILFVSPSLFGGAIFVDDVALRRLDVVGVPTSPAAAVLELRPVAPNPFRDRATIGYSLPMRGHASVVVYDVTGRRVATVFEGEAEPGAHVTAWDGRAADGRMAPAGVYRAVVRTDAGRQSRTMVLNR